jgi:thiamine pyrophosphokinase
MQQEAVIIANGQFPKKESVINILKEADYLICCDGAISNLDKHNILPDVIVGDLDSIPENLLSKYNERIVYINEQDSNDLSKAFNYACKKGVKKISILGATGKRDDHTLANISLLYKYNKELETSLITDYGLWTVISKSTTLDSYKGQQVSLFSNNGSTPIFSKGLKYKLNGLQLDELWKGTLNESISNEFSLEFENAQIIIFRES